MHRENEIVSTFGSGSLEGLGGDSSQREDVCLSTLTESRWNVSAPGQQQLSSERLLVSITEAGHFELTALGILSPSLKYSAALCPRAEVDNPSSEV